ncbi:MAG: hypothetical protein ACJ789_02155 [Thermomicrobiales bacterium]
MIGGPDDAVGADSPVRELGGCDISIGRREQQLAQHAHIAKEDRSTLYEGIDDTFV